MPVAPVIPADLGKEDKKDIIAAAKEAVPPAAKKGSGFTNEDWLMLGLNMLAKNTGRKGFGQVLGEAGLPTLMSKKEREKAEREQESQGYVDKYRQSQAALNEAQAGLAGAQAEYFGEARKIREAEAAVEKAFNNWIDAAKLNPTGKFDLTPEVRQEAYDRILRETYKRFNIPLPAGIGPVGAPAAIPENAKVTRVG
jgi:hypothetical protein